MSNALVKLEEALYYDSLGIFPQEHENTIDFVARAKDVLLKAEKFRNLEEPIELRDGRILDEIGYHCRDYFAKQMDKFRGVPGGVMAHSTHLKGVGAFENGIETSRITVTLATGIPEERCGRINLGYVDYKTIDPEEWEGCEDEGVLLVRKAGETLYRLKS